MASNARVRERQLAILEKRAGWWKKFNKDLEKIRSTGDVPSHYVGGGQPFTRGKKSGEIIP